MVNLHANGLEGAKMTDLGDLAANIGALKALGLTEWQGLLVSIWMLTGKEFEKSGTKRLLNQAT